MKNWITIIIGLLFSSVVFGQTITDSDAVFESTKSKAPQAYNCQDGTFLDTPLYDGYNERLRKIGTDRNWQGIYRNRILLRSNNDFEVWGLISEEAAADTIINVLTANYDRIADSLNVELTSKVIVDVYPDLETFHIAIGLPDAPDWSVGVAWGDAKIDMVSPYNPGPVHDFESIMKVVTHELVHCFVYNLTNGVDIPKWINEGTATFLAYQPGYPCYDIDQNSGVIPELSELNVFSTFGDIGGYSFSYTIAEFIVTKLGGSAVLSQFLASTLDYAVLGYESEQELQDEWHQYLYINYACNYSGLHAAFEADKFSGTKPLNVSFNDHTTQENTITSWNWDFDNDGIVDSYEQNPTWIYDNMGTFSVSLTVSDGTNTATYTKNNYIKVLGSENFDNLTFGTDNSLEVISWNTEFFPLNGSFTVDYLSQIIPALDADVIAFQEIDDGDTFIQLINSIPGYNGYVAPSSGTLKLAYVFKADAIQVNSVYKIYTADEYSLPFPRRPFVMEYTYDGQDFVLINNHYKAMGDGILDPNDPYDEENRRWVATNLLVDYIETNFPNDNVMVVGDLNDEITDEYVNNVFQGILDDPNYAFADHDIAVGTDLNWSYPDYPSHIDHIAISNEIFDNFYTHSSTIQTLKIEDYFTDGWNDYTEYISDHRPVTIKLFMDEALVFRKDFEDQSITSGGWVAYSVTGTQAWNVPESLFGHNDTYCAKMSGYDNGDNENEDWLISPSFSPDNYDDLRLSFWNTSGYTGPGLELYWSNDYTGGDPQTATWTEIDNVQWHNGNTNWDWTFSEILDLSHLVGSSAHIAFKYTSTAQDGATWELDDILLSEAGNVFDISASVNTPSGGSISGAGTYFYGETVEMSATPASNYLFLNWTENGTEVSTDANYTFTVSTDRTLVANFEIQTYNITASANPSNGGNVSGTGSYDYGSTATLTATAASGYAFVNWTENGTVVSTDANYTFAVSSDRTLVANFEIQTYNITASANPSDGGSVSGAGSYDNGSTATLTATAASGYAFINWTENGTEVSTDANYTFTVSSDRTLVANFEIQTYNITASANPSNGGSVSGVGEYNYGATVTLIANPNTDFNFTNWTENGNEVSTDDTYSFVANQNRNLIANFESVNLIIDSDTYHVAEVYPNPTNSVLKVKLNTKIVYFDNVKLILIDNVGRKIPLQSTRTGGEEIQAEIGYLSPGFYYLQVCIDDKATEIFKIIKSQK